jgi:C_GCAxxG_C_C family probable redox protein
MSERSDVAVAKLLAGYNCAQAVLYSFCDDLGLDRNTALKLSTGFGGGMARKQEVCGAVTGGILALGFRHGRGEGQDKALTEKTYSDVRELISLFEAEHGSCICRTLLQGCDLNTPEGQLAYKQNDLLNKTCKRCVQTAVETLETLL